MLDTPVLFLIYKRPDTTARVFEQIRKVQPRQLFIVADGPKDIPGEKEACDEARQIATNVDWDCEVKTNFSDENLGCRDRVSSGITWFFEHVEEGIILEDDCFPSIDFFDFMSVALAYYRTNNKVFHINGSSSDQINESVNKTYLTKYLNVWGWGSWSNKWRFYQDKYSVKNYTKSLLSIIKNCRTTYERQHWLKVLELVKNEYDTWDYNWQISMWNNNGYAVAPSTNLIVNIGFCEGSTHTNNPNDSLAKREIENIERNIFTHDYSYTVDKEYFDNFMKGKGFSYKEGMFDRLLMKSGLKNMMDRQRY